MRTAIPPPRPRPARRSVSGAAVLGLSLAALLAAAGAEPGARVRRIHLIGDSTVKNGTKGLLGWGDPFAALFNESLVKVENHARGGRSSRTYLTEGLWDKVVAELRPGDLVLIQFGHNDGGPISGERARASLKGNGEETKEAADPKTGKPEVVHTYGWYLRKYARDARSKGATPVILSPVPRNIWKDDSTVARASNDYGKWAAEAARQEGALFLDLNEQVARAYEHSGRKTVSEQYFGTDHTHTLPAGARVTAAIVAEGLLGLKGAPIAADVFKSRPSGATRPSAAQP